MSVIRKLSKAIHHLPNGDRKPSPDQSPAESPKLNPSMPFRSFSPRRSLASVFQEKEYVSSSEDFSDLDYDGGTSKNAQKRRARKQQRESQSRLSLERKEESEERMKNKLEEASKHETEEMKSRYGELPLIQSADRSGESRINFADITSEMAGQEIIFRARLHHVRRMGSKLVFFTFRQQINTIQGVLNEVPGEASIVMLHWAEHIPRGSILKVRGVLQRPEVPVKSTTMHDIEIKITEMKVIVRRADPGE
jgi:ergosteryl-3beta-O-L-aspartate synthase